MLSFLFGLRKGFSFCQNVFVEAEFSLTNRRQTCRLCRGTFCAACTPHVMSLAAVDPQASPGARGRICASCFEERRSVRSHELKEQTEAQQRIVESLKAALRLRAAEVDDARSFLREIFGTTENACMHETIQTVEQRLLDLERSVSDSAMDVMELRSERGNKQMLKRRGKHWQ